MSDLSLRSSWESQDTSQDPSAIFTLTLVFDTSRRRLFALMKIEMEMYDRYWKRGTVDNRTIYLKDLHKLKEISLKMLLT